MTLKKYFYWSKFTLADVPCYSAACKSWNSTISPPPPTTPFLKEILIYWFQELSSSCFRPRRPSCTDHSVWVPQPNLNPSQVLPLNLNHSALWWASSGLVFPGPLHSWEVSPTLCFRFSVTQVKEAMQRIHDRGNIGKLILDVEKTPTPLVSQKQRDPSRPTRQSLIRCRHS